MSPSKRLSSFPRLTVPCSLLAYGLSAPIATSLVGGGPAVTVIIWGRQLQVVICAFIILSNYFMLQRVLVSLLGNALLLMPGDVSDAMERDDDWNQIGTLALSTQATC